MELNNSLLNELTLLRESVERIADALENIDEKLDELIDTEEVDYAELTDLLGMEEDEFDDDEFNGDEDIEEEFD
jgi:Fe-S-cluster formation regulator IscX/YfhJ